jgi:hypothetical protein
MCGSRSVEPHHLMLSLVRLGNGPFSGFGVAVLLEDWRLRIEAKHRENTHRAGAALSLQGKSYAAQLLNEIGTAHRYPMRYTPYCTR